MSAEEESTEDGAGTEEQPPRTRVCRVCSVEINAASARCPYCGARQFKHQPILGWRGAIVCLVVAAVAVLATRALEGGGRTTFAPFLGSNLALLLPRGYEDLNATAQHGTAAASFADPGNAANSEAVVATVGESGTPRSRMERLERTLASTPGAVRGSLFRVVFPGGLVAYEVPYTEDHVDYAVFAFDACGGAIGVRVTISASGAASLDALSLVLPQNAQPRCDGPAFSNVDRADTSVPLAPR
jgi:RNA polymerase subunit RPABC4/transcription elongation factor Spt4